MEKIKILNLNIAHNKANWQFVLDSNVDLALLQEASRPPDHLVHNLIINDGDLWLKKELSWRAVIAGVAKSEAIDLMPIKTQLVGGNDTDALMISRPGSLSAATIRVRKTGEVFIVVSMYANWMNPIEQVNSRWIFADASAHRLISDLSTLIGQQGGHKIIAAGDLNLLHGYGEGGSVYWGKRYATVFNRMEALGLKFIGPQTPDGGKQADPWPAELPEGSLNVPTFRTHKDKPETATRQLDYVFASESIADRISVKALNSDEEWGPSDHCRIMMELAID